MSAPQRAGGRLLRVANLHGVRQVAAGAARQGTSSSDWGFYILPSVRQLAVGAVCVGHVK